MALAEVVLPGLIDFWTIWIVETPGHLIECGIEVCCHERRPWRDTGDPELPEGGWAAGRQ
jgi:hypothetical protein